MIAQLVARVYRGEELATASALRSQRLVHVHARGQGGR